MDKSPSLPEVRSSRREWIGFLILIAVLLPYKLWRMSWTSNLWTDEMYTFFLSTKSIGHLIDLASVDAHPPLEFLLVKGWYALGTKLFGPVGIFWGRLMDLGPWLLAAAAAWFGGRRLLGPVVGSVAAWATIGSAQMFDVTQSVRGYALVCPALFLCFLVLLAFTLEGSPPGSIPPRRAYIFWFLYALFGSIALWSHILGAFALTVFGLFWIGLVVKRRALRLPLGIGGIVAQSAIVVGFIPWMWRIPSQYMYFNTFSSEWMPHPTFEAWLNAFRYYFPFGELRLPPSFSLHPLMLLGTLAVAAPLVGVAVAARRREPPPSSRDRILLYAGLLGCGVAAGYVSLTWLVHRAGLGNTFLGLRYVSLVAAPWAFGLAAFAGYAARLFRRRGAGMVLLLLPWFIAGITGEVLTAHHERQMGLRNWLERFNGVLVNSTRPLYVMPEEAIPVFQPELPQITLLPFRDLSLVTSPQKSVVVFDASLWPTIPTPPHRVAERAILEKTFADRMRLFEIHYPLSNFKLYWMGGFDPSRRRDLLDRRFEPYPVSVPPEACSVARVGDQLNFDGWQELEIDDDFHPYRWGRGPKSLLVFDRPLPSGDYTLRIRGFRRPYPHQTQTMTFQFRGEPETYSKPVEAGPIDLSIPVRFEHEHKEPVLEVHHPMWSPATELGTRDRRHLSWRCSVVWIEKAEPSHPSSP